MGGATTPTCAQPSSGSPPVAGGKGGRRRSRSKLRDHIRREISADFRSSPTSLAGSNRRFFSFFFVTNSSPPPWLSLAPRPPQLPPLLLLPRPPRSHAGVPFSSWVCARRCSPRCLHRASHVHNSAVYLHPRVSKSIHVCGGSRSFLPRPGLRPPPALPRTSTL